jgi:hypothetical protein
LGVSSFITRAVCSVPQGNHGVRGAY